MAEMSGNTTANQPINNAPTNATQTAANTRRGLVGITTSLPVPPKALHGHSWPLAAIRVRRGLTASEKISMMPSWVGVSPKAVRGSVRLTAHRVAEAIEVYRDSGQVSRAAYLLAVVTAAAAPTDADTARLPELLHEVQLCDVAEERPDELFRHALTSGSATVEQAEAAVRFYMEQALGSERAARAVLKWISEQKDGAA